MFPRKSTRIPSIKVSTLSQMDGHIFQQATERRFAFAAGVEEGGKTGKTLYLLVINSTFSCPICHEVY